MICGYIFLKKSQSKFFINDYHLLFFTLKALRLSRIIAFYLLEHKNCFRRCLGKIVFKKNWKLSAVIHFRWKFQSKFFIKVFPLIFQTLKVLNLFCIILFHLLGTKMLFQNNISIKKVHKTWKKPAAVYFW